MTLVALSVPICFIYLSVRRLIEKDARLLLDSYLAEVRSEVEAHPDRPDAAVRVFTERLRRITPELEYGAALLHADGSYGFRLGSLAGEPERPAPGATGSEASMRLWGQSARGEPLLTATTPLAGGTLETAISRSSFAGSVDRIRRLILVSAPLALGLSALCGAWLARRSLRPIADMTEAARRIGGADLSERIATRGTSDELDQLAVTLNGMFDRIREAMERLQGFSADAAHQLKSPLASLQNEIEVTLEEGDVDPDTRSLLERLLAQVAELGSSVSAMLRLARSESGLAEGQAVALDLGRLLESVATLFQPMAEERGICLELGVAPAAAEVRGDVAWLRELFANLVQNAIAHTSDGGRIGIALSVKPETIEVQVSDTGEGIPRTEQRRVFDRFYRISPSRGVSGSGLGLALAQQIAVAHGGSIGLESEPGRGSTFTVLLPHHRARHDDR